MTELPLSPYGTGSYAATGTGSGFTNATRLTAAVIASAWLIGTGGTTNPEYFSRRNQMGYRFPEVESSPAPQSVAHRTPAENVTNIRKVLKPTVSELASLFRVSRQTVYDWQNGTQPGSDYEMKLEDLSRAADVFLTEGVPVTPYLLKRRVSGGKTLFDFVREGGSAEVVARQLTEMVLRELRQRRALDARLTGRKPPATDYADAGVPAFNERS
ncbi:MAG: helix-turn-helix transcriptional regulator [Desulfomonile tiedjei]|nr:helix-turn-helix transcriptional regulator [Desulfomonile tiedjei]